MAAHLHTVASVLDRRAALRPRCHRARQHDAGALGPTGDVAGVPSVSSSALGVAVRRCGRSGVVKVASRACARRPRCGCADEATVVEVACHH